MAVRLDASGDYYSQTGTPTLSGGITCMAWVYTTASGAWQSIFNFGGQDDEYYAGINDSDQWYLTCDTFSQRIESGSVSTATWYHVAYKKPTGNGTTGTIEIVVDGASVVSGSKNMNIVGTPFTVGRSTWWSEQFLGRIFAVKVYERELTNDEIRQEMHTIRPVDFSNLWGWWPQFPGSGERTRDYSGNGRDWTENGTLTDEDPPPVSYGGPILTLPFVAAVAGISSAYPGRNHPSRNVLLRL